MPVDANELSEEGREARAREEPPLATFEAPVLVLSEEHVERYLGVRPRRADLDRIFIRVTLGEHEIEDALRARVVR